MTLTLGGRLQTRALLILTVGVLWTAVITPVLPRISGMALGATYRMTFASLGLMTILGLLWECVYHVIQQARWDKDWPSIFALVTVANEAILLWLAAHALGVMPGSGSLSSPLFPAFAVHVTTTWIAIWLFLQGPLRVVHARWRFQGGRVLSLASGRSQRRGTGFDDDPPSRRDPVGREVAPARRQVVCLVDPADSAEPGDLVAGVTCPRGHFCHADAAYCAVCGTALTPAPGPPTLGPRPLLGVLILADGTTRPLQSDVGIVRAGSGALDFVPLEEQSAEVRVAEIRLIGWQPVVASPVTRIDVELPGGGRVRADINVPVPLVPGAEFRLDDQLVRFESLYQAADASPELTLPSPDWPVPAAPSPVKAKPRKQAVRSTPAADRYPQTAAVAAAVAIVIASTVAAALAAGITVAATALGLPS